MNIRNRLICGIFMLIFKSRMLKKNRFLFLKRCKDFCKNDYRLGKIIILIDLISYIFE